MPKTYVFAIGGTGARVLKSLSFLLAAGVKCNASKIVPIIIDPDKGNGDKKRTINILRSYAKIKSSLDYDNEIKNQFFKTEIEGLNEDYGIHIEDSNQSFRDFMDFRNLSESNKALVSLLFSQNNLDAQMEVGFKGNPNMGSLVLNQFQNSEDFQEFASSFQQDDKIFIISSIFGGTGAAGFPLLVKNLRQPPKNLTNNNLIKTADIGGISVLPYFGVKNDDGATVDRRTFMSKTRAALSYYKTNLNDQLDALYYIGDQISNQYDNNEGSVQQKNDAHIVELASALAVLDFANRPIIQRDDDDSIQTQVKEFGIQSDTQEVTFNDLYDQTKYKLLEPLTQFYLTHLYFENRINKDVDKKSRAKFANDFGMHIDTISQPFFGEFTRFRHWFYEWLEELGRNQRAFTPFELQDNTNEFYNKVKGVPLKKGNFLNGGFGFDRYTSFLNKAAKKTNLSGRDISTRFMEINYKATKELIEK